jgi:Glycosyl hydrolases family 28
MKTHRNSAGRQVWFAWLGLATALFTSLSSVAAPTVFDARDYGALGDGVALDSPAIQKAIDAAAAAGHGARVLVSAGRYLIGTIELRSNLEFHLAAGAELIISTNRIDYQGEGVIVANRVRNLRLTGTGKISGRAREFMTSYDSKGEWWVPAEWRPKMFLLTSCTNLEIRDLTVSACPQWGLHLLGCQHVTIRKLSVRNLLDVPNCDGIDPDHCQDVDIRDCNIVCGDDAIVIKTTRQEKNYGPSAHIHVRNCVLQTQDSGLKIGTETTQDIFDIRFEHCQILTGSRGLTIQLRDEGDVHDICFADISLISRYFADPWWGRGEAISLTAIPRYGTNRLGSLHDVRFNNIRGRAENSARFCGMPGNPIHHIRLENVGLTFDRWTKYPGAVFDNRPTTLPVAIELHRTPGIFLRYAEAIELDNCTIQWGNNAPDSFSYALEGENVRHLKLKHFKGQAAHPERDQPVYLR